MRHKVWCLAVLSGLLMQAGCGPGRGNVTGVVMYKDKAPAGATITFFDEHNGAPSGVIAEDGSYTVKNVATGTSKISIVSPMPILLPGMPEGAFHKVPEKYADCEQSGLTHKVASGKNKRDFDLQD